MWRMHLRIVVCALFLLLCASPLYAQLAVPGQCHDGVLPKGALSRICVPASGWNGDLIVWAHGYTAFNEPIAFQNLTLQDGTSLPDLVQALGFAFATTSYRQNGLAILEGVDDIRELVAAFPAQAGAPAKRVFMTGASEGGIVSALAVERSPQLFSGALCLCGPVGSFRSQVDYVGDFRVLFDYYFPNVLPGSPINIPPNVITDWDAVFVPQITAAVQANPNAARQLIKVSRAATDPADSSTITNTIVTLLWYNVFGTNDASQKLGGNPFDNRNRFYFGSTNDLQLNLSVKRFAAAPAALNAMVPYETSGIIRRPTVTLHTTGDQIIPYFHELLYIGKVQTLAGGSFLPIPVNRYGHCNFTTQEAVNSFLILLFMAGN
jgi:hypothetical protein